MRPINFVKGHTYVSDVQPVGALESETWWSPSLRKAQIYNGLGWVDLNFVTGLYNGTGSNYGYNMGGGDNGGYLSKVDRITFPFDSGTASIVGNLSANKGYSAGCNSSNYGYNMGGGGYLSKVDRLTFPFDSGTASIVGNLSTSKYYSAGCDTTDFTNLFV